LKLTRAIVLMMLLASAAGCATRVPFDKLRYVGDWQSESVRLLITEGGYVRFEQYSRVLGGDLERGMHGPLKGFDGNNFTVGIGPMSSHFIVDKPPYLDGDQWKMVVRGRELVRVD